MASGTKLVLGFETSSGRSMTLTYNHARPSSSLANVKALMNGIITNGSIFTSVPAVAKSAKEVTTTENVYDLDE